MIEYKHIKVHIVGQILQWYGVEYAQLNDAVLEPRDWSKREPFTHEWRAFATIVSLMMCDEMREFRMNKRETAIYFAMPLSVVDMALSIAYHLKDEQSFNIVRSKVLTLIKEYNGRFYTSQSA